MHHSSKHNKFFGYLNIVFLLVLFVSVNIWGGRLFNSVQLDLTEDKIFSISGATTEVLESIKEPIRLSFYTSENLSLLGPDYISLMLRIEGLLETYKLVAGSNLIIERIVPKPFSPEEDQAVSDGIHAIPDVLGNSQIFFGLTGHNSTNGFYTIPHFAPEQNNLIEYELTRLIYDLENTKKRTVAIYGDLPISGDKTQRVPPWTILETIKRFFSVQILFGDVQRFSSNIDVLVLTEPGELSKTTLYAIDQFILRGGRVLAFLDPFNETLDVSQNSQPSVPRSRGLDNFTKLLSAWGIEIPTRTVVGDLGGAINVQMTRNDRILATKYPVWFDVKEDGFVSDEVITSGLSRISLRSAGYIKHSPQQSLKFQPILLASRESGFIDVSKIEYAPNPVEILANLQQTTEQKVLMARLSGAFKTAFPDGAPVANVNSENNLPHLNDSVQPSAVLLVADADLLADEAWLENKNLGGQTLKVPLANNGNLVVNALEQLVGTSSMIGLRGKGTLKRRFTLLEKLEQEAEIKYRKKENKLLTKIEDGKKFIEQIQRTEIKQGIVYSQEQQMELERKRNEMIEARKELRDVQFSAKENITELKNKIIFYNIWSVPILLLLLIFGLNLVRVISWRKSFGES